MAPRAQPRDEAGHRRQEQALAEQAHRQRRVMRLVGVVLLAVIVVGVAIAISVGGGSRTAPKPTSPPARAAADKVSALLAGIPQAGNRLGAPTAPVTVTEYGDLECPVCAAFAQRTESQLIAKDVRSGKVSLVYRPLCTATCSGGFQSIFGAQQAAAMAAGRQAREWQYILLFYAEQGSEGTSYVNDAYLNGLAGQIPGLAYGKWLSDRSAPALTAQVSAEEQQAAGQGFNSTPILVVKGRRKSTSAVGNIDYASLEKAIKSVS